MTPTYTRPPIRLLAPSARVTPRTLARIQTLRAQLGRKLRLPEAAPATMGALLDATFGDAPPARIAALWKS
jgi:hypothetical protein